MMGAEKPALGFPAAAEMDELELASPAGSPAPPPRKMRSLDFEHIGSLAAVAESLSRESKWGRALTSVRVVIFQAKINVLLPFGPLAIMLHYLSGKHVRAPHAVSESCTVLFRTVVPGRACESLLPTFCFSFAFNNL
jgi:Ca2+:H+ antiporter